MSPQQALAAFRVAPGLRVELAACEPQVLDPVSAAFDENGRLWIVEMGDYPNGPPPGSPPEGRVVVLDDGDGDGRYERRTVFADRLLMANGLMPWRGGVIVTAAPEILMLRDTDGNGRADVRETLFEGFAAQNPQLRVNHPTLGLDNRIYVANGRRGGKIARHGKPAAEAIDIGGRDFRFDPIRDRTEAVEGAGQFGLTFDEWGRRFVCTNRNPLVPLVMPDRYLRRNPFLAPPPPVQDNQSAGGAARIFPISRNWTTATFHAGSFSAACGVTVYRGSLLPEPHPGAVFTCDPTGNLIHEGLLESDGAGFRWRPAYDGAEFLASSDDWFRPVNLFEGYNGGLYVVDMYRAVIEHPEFMPAELKNRPDLLDGRDRGRIWRIMPAKCERSAAKPGLGRAPTADLVALLAHPDGWWRSTAQRLLLERQDKSAVGPLKKLAEASDSPIGRVHALWMLEGLGALDEGAVLARLSDTHPRVREHAIRLAEPWVEATGSLAGATQADVSPLRARVLALADDPDPRVRWQAALTLGAWDDDRILPALAGVARAGAFDRWTRLAVASASTARSGALAAMLLRDGTGSDLREVLRDLASVAGARQDPGEGVALLETLLSVEGAAAPMRQAACLSGLIDGLGRRGARLEGFLSDRVGAQHAASMRSKLDAVMSSAAGLATDAAQPLPDRLDAVRLLAHAAPATALPPLTRVLEDPLSEVRLAAVRALAVHPGPEASSALLAALPSQTSVVRREIAEALLRTPERVKALLEGIEAGRVRPGDVDPAQAAHLAVHPDAALRERAMKIFPQGRPGERKEALDRYRPAMAQTGDVARGRKVFEKACATCHRLAGAGVEVGPDLSDIGRTKTLDQMLLDVLDPNAAIDGNYVAYVVTRADETVVDGVVAAESSTAVTLRRPGGEAVTVLRGDIASMRSTGRSLMPEGLEKDIPVEAMADLLSFLKNWRYIEGGVPIVR